jgi:dihydrofolate reductase
MIPFSIIVAVAQNGAIGKDNALLWRLSSDLKLFKSLTTNHAVIMGRKTYDSIGRPLPNRINVVISRQVDLILEGVFVVSSLKDALAFASKEFPEKSLFVIGGGEIYRQALPSANRLFRTLVETTCDGDTFFPDLSDEWHCVSRVHYLKDEKNEFDFWFETWEK